LKKRRGGELCLGRRGKRRRSSKDEVRGGQGQAMSGEKDPQRLVAIAVTNAGERNPPTGSGSITVVRVREGLTFLPDAKE
jgi:hypothetical protein